MRFAVFGFSVFSHFEVGEPFRFGRFGIPFGSIDIGSEGRAGPLCL